MDGWLTLYLIPFLAALAISAGLVPLIRRWARRANIVRGRRPDHPQDVHVQRTPIPLLGGMAVVISFFVLVIYYALATDVLLGGFLLPKHLWGILAGGVVLLIGGYLDDRYELPAKVQWIFPVVAVLIIIASGIGINSITNPIGEAIRLDQTALTLFRVGDTPYRMVLWADLFAFAWVLGMIYTVKFNDGIDGLTSSINVISFLVLFFLSIAPKVAQPETAFLAVVMAGAILGLWLYQFPRAKIFVGEGGVWFIGFLLGVLAILSGGKLATALLVMGVMIIDTARVIIGRIWRGRSPFRGDATHLHHLLLRLGLQHWQIVIIICLPSLVFGVLALVLQGYDKFLALVALFIIMIVFVSVLGIVLYRRERRAHAVDEKR